MTMLTWAVLAAITLSTMVGYENMVKQSWLTVVGKLQEVGFPLFSIR